jgi:hypothetical protein
MKNKEIRIIGGDDKTLHPVFEAWFDIHSKYISVEGETAYDYSEGANTSLLVAAANSLEGWVGVAEHYVDRAPKDETPDPLEKSKKVKTNRGLLDAYLATEEHGYLIELKQRYMKPITKKDKVGSFGYYHSSPLPEAKKQIEQLDFKGSFATERDFTSYYGGFLIPSYNRKEYKIKQDEAVSRIQSICRESFSTYAIFGPDLSDEDLSLSKKNYRPVVALGLCRYD